MNAVFGIVVLCTDYIDIYEWDPQRALDEHGYFAEHNLGIMWLRYIKSLLSKLFKNHQNKQNSTGKPCDFFFVFICS
jgi:hypothetical protein